jgi:hypothetical protein
MRSEYPAWPADQFPQRIDAFATSGKQFFGKGAMGKNFAIHLR